MTDGCVVIKMGTNCDYDEDCKWRDENGECTWHDEDRPPIVAIDLDGVIVEFDGWEGVEHLGEPKKKAKFWMDKFRELGYYLVVWTTRDADEAIAEYLKEYGFAFDDINDHPWMTPDMSNKIYADVYIDDRGVTFNENWDEVGEDVVEMFGAYQNGENVGGKNYE